MKNGKLITGIFSCVLFVLISFQSCAATIVEGMESTDGMSGSAGIIVGLLILTAGIISIATRNTLHGGGTKTAAAMYFIAALIGFTSYGIYEDLLVWSSLCIAFGIMLVVFDRKSI